MFEEYVDGVCLYCKFISRLKRLGYKSNKIGLDIFKNNKNKFEKQVVMVAMVTTIHYMLYCKIVCL